MPAPTAPDPDVIAALDDWVSVPAYEFAMGGGERAEENPRHRVCVGAFRLARFQVTRRLYRQFLLQTGRAAPPFWGEPAFVGERLPAVGPSWNDAVAFCAWASEITSLAVRLPTEAEWEAAARAGRDVLFPFGDGPPEALPDYARRWQAGPEPVDAYPTLHPLGLYGMGENVHEWCSDWFDARYYEVSPAHDPQGPPSGRRRSSRGGSWRHAIKVSRCVARSSIPPDFQYSDYGFRIATSGDPCSTDRPSV